MNDKDYKSIDDDGSRCCDRVHRVHVGNHSRYKAEQHDQHIQQQDDPSRRCPDLEWSEEPQVQQFIYKSFHYVGIYLAGRKGDNSPIHAWDDCIINNKFKRQKYCNYLNKQQSWLKKTLKPPIADGQMPASATCRQDLNILKKSVL